MMGPLAGKRILVLEDEYFIAADMKRALVEQGTSVVGPAPDVQRGLDLARQPLDAAVLDVNLDGRASFEVARELQVQGVPFMFVTGYDSWAMLEEYRSAPSITKPCRMEHMISALEQLVRVSQCNFPTFPSWRGCLR